MEGMFVAHEVALRVSLASAQARLADLARGRGLSDASEAAYKGGLAGLVRVGPLGDIPGASKLVQVSVLDPVYRDDAMTLALRWEATGATGGLFPVLDADISLLPAAAGPPRLRPGQGDPEPYRHSDHPGPATKRRGCPRQPRHGSRRGDANRRPSRAAASHRARDTVMMVRPSRARLAGRRWPRGSRTRWSPGSARNHGRRAR